jgi:hypothetical protein
VGHNRLGRLPRTRRWREVVALLENGSSAELVAQATATVADKRYRELGNSDALNYAFWLLTLVIAASRKEDFLGELAWVGVRTDPNANALNVISAAAQHVRKELSRLPEQNDFTDILPLALSRALTETVGRHGPGLFSSTGEDAQRAFRAHSTATTFSEVAHAFFADVMARSLRAFVDRELSNQTAPSKAIKSIGDDTAFLDALDLHSRQGARTVEEFAGGWYSRHNWETSGDISLGESAHFVGQAMRKIRSELRRNQD